MGLIFTDQTTLARDTLALPSVLFGSRCCGSRWWREAKDHWSVLLPSIKSFSRIATQSHKCCEVAHKGDNLDRYLLGRQFMVVVMVFTINISGGPIADATLWGFLTCLPTCSWVLD
jgi:hypothetical protein